MFSYEFYEISQNTFFYETPPVAASIIHKYHGTLLNESESNGLTDIITGSLNAFLNKETLFL